MCDETTELCLPLTDSDQAHKDYLELELVRQQAEAFLEEREQDLAMAGWV
jgi:hypothetical protein